MDALVSDEMVEDWFSSHAKTLTQTSEIALAKIAPWIPIIGVAANEGTIGTIDRHWFD